MNELVQIYREWVLAQELEGCTLTQEGDNVVITSDFVKGGVNFYDIDGSVIVELRLERILDGETAFFLHFELVDLLRAQELFNEMAEVIHDMTHHKVRHVLLCCTCGITTTMFASKMTEAAEATGVDYDFCALPIEEAKRQGADYAAVLLAPQVAHRRKEVVEALPDTPIIELPGKIFGSYDANAALRLVVDALSGARSSRGRGGIPCVVRELDNTKCVLAVSYIHRTDEPTLSYQIYDHGMVALTGMLVRRSFDKITLEDLAVTLRVQGWKTEEFDAVGVAVPGIVYNGSLVEYNEAAELRINLSERISELWGTKVFVDYNASAAAVGCYITQDAYENVAFHAQAVGVFEGNGGYVIDGKPLIGHHGCSGHLGPLARQFALSAGLEDAAWRVNGMRELVGRYLVSLACTLAPDVVYIWCDLLPDMEELRQELLKEMPESMIPELVSVADYDGRVLVGEIALILLRLAQ